MAFIMAYGYGENFEKLTLLYRSLKSPYKDWHFFPNTILGRLMSDGNNGPRVGITGTPVIDLAARTLYVIAYVNGSPPIYQLHALDLITLGDKLGPVTVTASHKLTDGTTFTFDATFQRQRPALLLQN